MNDTAETIAAPGNPSLGSLIDQYFELRSEKKEHDAASKECADAMASIEADLLELFDQQGLNLCRGRKASASISEVEIPIVEDWDAYQEYIKENDALHLLERRPATRAWRELYESGELVPGTSPFKKRGINVRKI